MELSANIGWVDDDPVTVSCGVGYVLDTGVLKKNITCVLVNGDAVWSDTLGSCTSKATIVIVLITFTTSFTVLCLQLPLKRRLNRLRRLNTCLFVCKQKCFHVNTYFDGIFIESVPLTRRKSIDLWPLITSFYHETSFDRVQWNLLCLNVIFTTFLPERVFSNIMVRWQ